MTPVENLWWAIAGRPTHVMSTLLLFLYLGLIPFVWRYIVAQRHWRYGGFVLAIVIHGVAFYVTTFILRVGGHTPGRQPLTDWITAWSSGLRLQTVLTAYIILMGEAGYWERAGAWVGEKWAQLKQSWSPSS